MVDDKSKRMQWLMLGTSFLWLRSLPPGADNTMVRPKVLLCPYHGTRLHCCYSTVCHYCYYGPGWRGPNIYGAPVLT